MGFRLRDSGDGFTSATWITADGRSEPIAPGTLKLTPLETEHVAGRDVPVRWRVELPGKGVDITTTPLNPPVLDGHAVSLLGRADQLHRNHVRQGLSGDDGLPVISG